MLNELKLYFSEIRKAQKYFSNSFSLINSIKSFRTWKKSLRPGRSPLDDESPWMVFDAIEYLNDNLNQNMKVFEYGSGGSSVFFSNRVEKVISIEHEASWFTRVKGKVEEKKLDNWVGITAEPERDLDYNKKRPCDFEDYISGGIKDVSFRQYASAIDIYPDEYFDVIVIDGRARPSCFYHSYKKLRKNGLMVLDNSERDYYSTIFQFISNQLNWKLIDFYGPGPYNVYFWRTSIWKKNS